MRPLPDTAELVGLSIALLAEAVAVSPFIAGAAVWIIIGMGA